MTSSRSHYFTPKDDALALLTLGELRTLEARAASALPPHTLMARAGAAAAQFLLESDQHSPERQALPVWIAAGPGNNGGDALVLAAELQNAGVAVEVCMPVEVKPDDARWALDTARAAGVSITAEAPPSLQGYSWVVDGMFGIGLTRPLEGVFAELASRIAARSRREGGVLALDVPSGLNSDTGEAVSGGAAVRATHTITFIGAKPGHYTAQGRDLTGNLYVATLDVAPPAQPSIVLNAPSLFAAHLPPRDYASNKGTFGTLAVIGGDTGMCGAPILAARMALFGGAGKVNVAFLGAGAPPYDPPHPELMLHHVDDFAARQDGRALDRLRHGVERSREGRVVERAGARCSQAARCRCAQPRFARRQTGGRGRRAGRQRRSVHPHAASARSRAPARHRREGGAARPHRRRAPACGTFRRASRCSRVRAPWSPRRMGASRSIRPATPRSRPAVPATCSAD